MVETTSKVLTIYDITGRTKTAKHMHKNVYVVHTGNRWGVKLEGKPKPLSTHRTQGLALDRARPIAKANESELRIQGRDRKFVDADSYGNDPGSIKDKKH